MGDLNIVYQSDDNYAVFMGVSICSLLENNKNAETINIYIIDDAISEKNKKLLNDMVNSYSRKVIFLSGENVLNNKEITDAFAYVGMRKNTHSYLKLFLDYLLPECNERLLYIDCDTAVTGDLQELMSIDLKGNTLGMVKDSLVIKSKKSIGFNKKDNYYNSGVILIDLAKWRERNCSTRILDHVKNVRIYGTVDQDVLNVELKEEIFPLPVKYNLQPVHLDYPYSLYCKIYKHEEEYYSEEEITDAVREPGIIHYLRYIGESPWNEGNVHPGTKYFDKYLELSPWKGYQKKRRKNGWVFELEKWMYKNLSQGFFLRVFYIVHESMITKSNKKRKNV